MPHRITIQNVKSAFEQEPLCRPFGFKGRYLTELWQVVAKLTTAGGASGLGLGTQSVLYSDSSLFSTHSEAEGNALMYALTVQALDILKDRSFATPLDLIEQLVPEVLDRGQRLTRKRDLNPNFVYNALVSIDHAAWVLYKQQNKFLDFDGAIPEPYRATLSHRQERIAVMYQVSYGVPLEELVSAAEAGYFVFKIKTGYPGSQQDMLEKDQQMLSAIHDVLGRKRTPHTPSRKIYYTMDANGRYRKKELILRYLDHARRIGAFDHILMYEEPVNEENEEDLSDTGVRIAGDESIYDALSAERKIAQGYQAIVLKGIAKNA